MSDNARIQLLEAQLRLVSEADDILEATMRTHTPLADAIPRLLNVLVKATSAEAALVRTRDEEGDLHDYGYPSVKPFQAIDLDTMCDEVIEGDAVGARRDDGEAVYLGRRLDIADRVLGMALIRVARPEDEDGLREILASWAEQVDNFLGAVADSHRKQRAMERISDALKRPILEEGLDSALEILHEYAAYDDLVLVFMSENFLDRRSLTYRVIIGGETTYSSARPLDERIEALLRAAAHSIVESNSDEDTLRGLQVTAPFIEDIPIHGRNERSVIGRMIVGSNGSALTPFARDIVDRFADYLRQRAVDFSKEWRQLSRQFPQPLTRRLLQEPDYVDTYLTPRRRQVAILYTDISGFTHLSERVLREPERIGALVDRWSRHVVDIVWETGGVFDKMVGDCIIGLWGPPFFEMTGKQACERAVEAAIRIREYTRLLGESDEFPELAGQDLTVSTGVNYCPLFVGFFGPGQDYTGFSSGMNNTARLQGLADPNEILVMSEMAAIVEAGHTFGPIEGAEVKNVSEPLTFRRLLDS